MDIKTKAESDYTIRKLGLNRVADRLHTQDNLIELEEYLKDNKDLVYNIRDKSSAMGEFRYKLTADEVLEIAHTYEKFSVYESLYSADKNMILQGDISLDKQFNLLASLDDIKNISNRQAMTNPKYTIEQSLVERREPSIKGLTKVIDFMVEHMLFGVIMEFTLYSEPVGTNKEEIIVWELRNY